MATWEPLNPSDDHLFRLVVWTVCVLASVAVWVIVLAGLSAASSWLAS